MYAALFYEAYGFIRLRAAPDRLFIAMETIARAAETTLQRPLRFWAACRDGAYHERLEPSSDAWAMARDIHLARGDIDRVRLILITDGVASAGSEYYEPELLDGVEVLGP